MRVKDGMRSAELRIPGRQGAVAELPPSKVQAPKVEELQLRLPPLTPVFEEFQVRADQRNRYQKALSFRADSGEPVSLRYELQRSDGLKISGALPTPTPERASTDISKTYFGVETSGDGSRSYRVGFPVRFTGIVEVSVGQHRHRLVVGGSGSG